MANTRANYRGSHILTNDYAAQTNTWETHLNNNVLIFGPSGAGKTRHYVKPNLLASHESMVISDTKGSLCQEVGPLLKKRGFKVLNLNFTDLSRAGIGYDPFDAIRCDPSTHQYNRQDIQTLCHGLISGWSQKDPYWDHAARQYLKVLVTYELETNPEGNHMENLHRLAPIVCTQTFRAMVDELNMFQPGNKTAELYEPIRTNEAEKMTSSICGILTTNLEPLYFEEGLALYARPERIDFSSLGREKTALFLTVSDTDRSMDKLANLFMTQAIQSLCFSADHDCPDHRLPIPVRFYLDDFATNLFIPDFDKIISVIRSREISVSIILQSLTQLYSLYGPDAAKTIVNNCDRQLYLGGQDLDTADYIARRTNQPLHRIIEMPLDRVYLLVRGEKPRLSQKYAGPSLTELPDDTPDAAPGKSMTLN